MIIHRPKLRWSPKLGHIIMHRRICPSIRDRLRRWREAVNAVTLRDDNRPKIKNLVCWGGGGGLNRTRSGRVPEQVWTRHRPATGTGPVNFCRCERNTNEWNGTGTGPERDRNGTGTGTRTGTRTGTGVNTALDGCRWPDYSCVMVPLVLISWWSCPAVPTW